MKNELQTIQKMIHEVRGLKVMLDSDLAALYEVEAKYLNRAVKRNIDRFPSDFMFQLSNEEWSVLRCQIGTIEDGQGKHRKYLPYVFTEQGVSMLSSVLNSARAIQVNISIMRAFVKLRHYVISQSDTNAQIAELKKILMLHIENTDTKLSKHDKAIRHILQVLDNLIEKPPKTRQIGFGT